MVDLFISAFVKIDCQAHWCLATSHSPRLETSNNNKMASHFAVVDLENNLNIQSSFHKK